MSKPLDGLALLLLTLIAGCTTQATPDTDPQLIREALRGTGSDRRPMTSAPLPATVPQPAIGTAPGRQVVRGSARFIRDVPPVAGARPAEPGSGGVMLNFTNQPIVAIINTIMGDLLQENYSIAQGVTGEVSFSTSRPIPKDQAMAVLESLLGWTNNAMIRQGDRYVILPANQAVAGQLVPSIGMGSPPRGMSVRLYPLQFISAAEMQKLLKPFARESAFLLVDPARNVIGMAGTPEELANYQSTIQTFDVDWLRGMSVGVFGLQRASVAELMPELQKVFGAESGTPLAGMLRFLPIERTNSIVVISSQPQYLQEVGQWIRTIDEGGGNEPQLYVYDVRNMKAADLARYLRQIYGTGAIQDQAPAQVAPGLSTTVLSSPVGSGSGLGRGSVNAMGRATGGYGGMSGDPSQGISRTFGGMSEEQEGGANAEGTAEPGGDKGLDDTTRITAQKSSNQLLVRTRPSHWAEIESAIRRLDNAPMQVQIETRILEVTLSDELDLGVQWYLGNLAGNSTTEGIADAPGSQGALGFGGVGLGPADALFYSFVGGDLQVAIRALEATGKTQVLSAPSLVVMNNQQAQIQVGDNIPISQTTVNTINTDTTLSSVEYIQTGVILDVVPRINPGGLVYLDIHQQVSDAGATTSDDVNPRISTRSIATQVAVQSGETVLLGGLIRQDDLNTRSQVPYLGSIPGLGWLFGASTRTKGRTELIVLITPRVVTSSSEARSVTDEYRDKMRLLNVPGSMPAPSLRGTY